MLEACNELLLLALFFDELYFKFFQRELDDLGNTNNELKERSQQLEKIMDRLQQEEVGYWLPAQFSVLLFDMGVLWVTKLQTLQKLQN